MLSQGIFERGFSCHPFGSIALQTYESNIEYVLRFMIDRAVPGAGWVELSPSKYRVRPVKTSNCQIEVDVAWNEFISHSIDGEYSVIAPLRILSFGNFAWLQYASDRILWGKKKRYRMCWPQRPLPRGRQGPRDPDRQHDHPPG